MIRVSVQMLFFFVGGVLTNRRRWWCWLAVLLLSCSVLHNVTSADKLKNQTTVWRVAQQMISDAAGIMKKKRVFFMSRIQAFQCSSALRCVLWTAKNPIALERSSSLHLWYRALIHVLQNVLTSRTRHARWARATTKKKKKQEWKYIWICTRA